MKQPLVICATVVLLIGCQAETPSIPIDSDASTVAVDSPAPSTTGGTSPARERAMEIEGSKDTLRSEAKSGSIPGGAVHAVRYYVGSTLVLVEEVLESPDLGRSQAAYYFDDDQFIFFRGLGTRTIYASDGSRVVEQYDIELGFNSEGEVVDSRKIINGSEAELEPLDWGAPKAKANALLAE